MRKLTFSGFTKKYIASLSLSGTTAIYPLVREATTVNLRLREPLFLYAFFNQRIHTLLTASHGTGLYPEYKQLVEHFRNPSELLAALEQASPELSTEYHKVWNSFQVVASQHERDTRVKSLIRDKVCLLKDKKNISTYRISKELLLNNANVNAWIKHGHSHKISLDAARKIMAYLNAC